jgi:hypothetical protein
MDRIMDRIMGRNFVAGKPQKGKAGREENDKGSA